VNAFANDLARVATLEYTNSVGQSRMRWLASIRSPRLSHEPDSNKDAQEKLVKINIVCGATSPPLREARRHPEPGAPEARQHTSSGRTNSANDNSHSHITSIPPPRGGLDSKPPRVAVR
jgi:hypothetical protein